MKITAYALNAFSKTEDGGNPAGVILNADSLSDIEMQRIATTLGFSETAFVSQSRLADYKVRFFTPSGEVDLCGHATIATFYTLLCLELVTYGRYSQETKTGVLGIEIMNDNTIMMDQANPIFAEVLNKNEVADSLNISVSNIPENFVIQVVSTGLRDIIVPVKSMKVLHALNPDMEKVSALSRTHDAIGYHVFSLDSLQGATAHCRNFAPLYGIPEESATGTASGALASYLYHYGKISADQASNVVFEQGYSMNKPSEIRASITVNYNEICKVSIGGTATNLSSVEIEISESIEENSTILEL